MVKKIFTTLLIIILVSFVIAGYFYLTKLKDYKETDLLKAVPVNTELIIEFENAEKLISKLNNNTEIWTELNNFDFASNINKKLSDLNSFFQISDNESKFDLDRPLILTCNLVGKDDTDYLFITPLHDFLEETNLKNYIKNLYRTEQIKERTYNRTKIYTILPAKNRDRKFNYTFSGGLLIMSYSNILLEDAIRQLSASTTLSDNEGFAKIQRTIGENVDANIYLNLKTLPKQISLLLNKKYRKFADNLKNVANWTELDFILQDDLILLNGFSYSDTNQTNYLNLFIEQKPVKMEIESVLPANTSLILSLGIDDVALFRNQYRDYLEQTYKMSQHIKNLGKVKSKIGVNVEEIFYSILYKELALAFTDNKSENKIAVIRTKSSSIARSKMMQIIEKYAQKQNKNITHYKSEYKLDSKSKFEIYKLPDDKLLYKVFGNIFAETTLPYFTFVDNYLIFGQSKKTLTNIIKQYALGTTLRNNAKYKQNKEYLSDKCNFYFYTNMSRSSSILSSYLNANLRTTIKKHRNNLNKFQAIAFQFSSAQNMIYNNAFIKYDPKLDQSPQTDWESRLDAGFNHKPYFVKNHNTGENEIMLQDAQNQLYLINSSGRILWTKSLPSQIVGEIYQIDYYKNNKLQYLFTTKNEIHLIDRNGNNVEKYPIKLKSQVVKGLSLFDYEKNRNYRLFIPCKNKKIYCYSKEGKIVKGWKFDKAENQITGKIQHFVVDNKDYIVFTDKFRVYILNRRGEERVKLHEQFSKSEQNIFKLQKNSRTKGNCLVTTDISGTIYKCYLNGKVEKRKIREFTPKHFFIYDDVDSDGRPDYIFADNKTLDVYNSEGKEIFKKELKKQITKKPSIYAFSARNKKIGVCIEKENKIYLFNNQGENHKGFPLKGNTEFSIGFTKKSQTTFNLLVGDEQGFLLNYTVR